MIGGIAEVIITSADLTAVLAIMEQYSINIKNVEYMDLLRIRFSVSYRDLPILNEIIKKRGESLKIVSQTGFFLAISRLLFRPVLSFGLLLVLALSCWLPTRILFVRLVGNENIPSKLILQQAEMCGIHFLSSRREVRSEKIKNALLAQLPQLQWAGVNTYGCTALISVQERKEKTDDPFIPKISHIVARCDAIVGEMIVKQGNSLCKTGQAVTSGQILVSGYTDCGICIKATEAKADVYGETLRNLTAYFPTEYQYRQENTSRLEKYSLILGKIRINFFKGSGISGTSCAKIYEEKYMTLPGGFVLPIAIVCETVVTYTYQVQSTETAEAALSEFAHNYITSQMQSGSILHADEVFTAMDGCCRLDGIFRCYEIIGITRVEERIVKNE